MNRKAYKAPFWVMLFITVLLAISSVLVYISVARLSLKSPGRLNAQFSSLLIAWPVLLLAETIVYWVMRKKIIKRVFVWLHIAAMFLAFIILPAVFIFINAIMARIYPPSDYYEHIRNMTLIRLCLFWLLFAVAHAFFVGTIVKAVSKKETSATDNDQPAGILDGIIDEDAL